LKQKAEPVIPGSAFSYHRPSAAENPPQVQTICAKQRQCRVIAVIRAEHKEKGRAEARPMIK
jgi:hypothetical protein